MKGRKKWMGGGFDSPGIHSILVDPRDPAVVTVGVSTGGVWRTSDGGSTWQNIAAGLRAAYLPKALAFDKDQQDVHRLAQCAAAPERIWCQHHNGIFRTQAPGKPWREVKAKAPSRFGFACAAHPTDPDTAWFVPAEKDECRVPVDGALVVLRTDDGGRSFTELRTGLPQQHAYDLATGTGSTWRRTGVPWRWGRRRGGCGSAPTAVMVWRELRRQPAADPRGTMGGRMRTASICLLVACCGLPGCTTMRDDSRRTLDALDRNLTPSSPVARGLLLPVAIPVGLGGLLCDTVVVNPVCALDDAWLDTTDLLWTSRDESMLATHAVHAGRGARHAGGVRRGLAVAVSGADCITNRTGPTERTGGQADAER